MDHKTRQELNELSKKVFGTSSRWQKLVNNGILEPMERNREVMVPRANGGVVKKTVTDRKSVTKRYTVEEVRKVMLEIQEKNEARAKTLEALKSEEQDPSEVQSGEKGSNGSHGPISS